MKIEFSEDEVTCFLIVSTIVLGIFLTISATAIHKYLDNEAAKYKVEQKEAPRD